MRRVKQGAHRSEASELQSGLTRARAARTRSWSGGDDEGVHRSEASELQSG
jgi:hypothetical protein